MRIGSGYLGSSSIQTSTTNQEIIPVNPATSKPYICYKLSVSFIDEAYVKINDSDIIYYAADSSFECDSIDAPIHSFIITNANCRYHYVGAF